ncbi:LacI family DNA-binding transcriptional regulator [Streptomyces sp. HPF1205]|uniref:LacI family DNA-binding transcriptional regulator n=1 Tax=Streptomyces sp. HPF1205 TaxID=2873262 RepID=UPI001CEC189D|nr:LacI family DNA-binding transcriptional regulator [Streptomyces sp. HPF1205]
MTVTIRDVARLAGVSASSVCRALATPDKVRATTRERVQKAAAQLGYHPNRVARGLSTGRTGNLGLVVPDIANPFFAGLVKAVQNRAHECDFLVLLADTDEDVAAEMDLIHTLTKQVDGFLLCSPRAGDEDLRLVGADLPVVMLNRRVGQIPSVIFDNADGVRQVITHLVALNHRRIGYVAGPKTSWVNRERLRAVRTLAASMGLELVETGTVSPTYVGGVAAADVLLAASVTAVIAYNDMIALGLISQITARGVRVPQDISVVGFDDIPTAGLVNPALTTVSEPKEQCGRAAVDLLVDLLNDREGPGNSRRVAPMQLVVRQTTAPSPV